MDRAFLVAYLAIFALHAVWAVYIIRRGLASLAIGPLRKPIPILIGLFVLNLPSAIVFVPMSDLGLLADFSWIVGFASPIAHGCYHILLAIDEIFRVRRDPARGLFLANHWAWAMLLFIFAVSQ